LRETGRLRAGLGCLRLEGAKIQPEIPLIAIALGRRRRLAPSGNSSYRLAPQSGADGPYGIERAQSDVKRLFDIVVSALVLIIGAPLFALVALLVRIKLGTPVLFVQKRPGLHGALFPMRKFRSMIDARGADGAPLDDAQRLPPFGKWLRSTSLDELPELWNVLVGEMSLVGPRPLLVEYLPLYSPEQARRHEVKPGVTGWAQVNGRNALSWDERFRLDVWYVDHRSFWLDLKILALSVAKILKREGVAHEGSATMPKFLGSAGESRRL
jgi:lipopolysaccharide/colanic/teichoic acid biosynthesis glycosyltransferase